MESVKRSQGIPVFFVVFSWDLGSPPMGVPVGFPIERIELPTGLPMRLLMGIPMGGDRLHGTSRDKYMMPSAAAWGFLWTRDCGKRCPMRSDEAYHGACHGTSEYRCEFLWEVP